MIFIVNFKRFLAFIAFFGLTSQAIAAPSYDFFKDSTERIDEAAAILKKSPTDAANVVLFLENLRDSYYTHLDRIEAALPYWQWAIHHPYRYTASQFPHKWFTHEKNQAEIEKIHAMINAIREVYSKEFGIIVRLLAMRQEDALDDATWLAEVKKGVATVLMTPLEDLSSTELIIQKLSDHEHDIAKMVEKVQSPNWLKRHWRSLLTTAVVTAVAAYLYMNNKESADNFCIDGVTRLKTNFIEYCYNPVKSFVDKFWKIKKASENNTAVVMDAPQKIIPDQAVSYKITQGDSVTILNSHEEADALYNATQLKADTAMKTAMDKFKEVENVKNAMQNVENKAAGTYTMANAISVGTKPFMVEGARFAQEIKDGTAQGLQHLGVALAETQKAVNIKIQMADQDKRTYLAYAHQLMQYGEQQIQNGQKVVSEKLEKIDFTFQLACLIPAGLFTYLSFQSVRNFFGWFTKRDRSTLINRLRQVQQVLIRTTHNAELSDTEYGRLLYLLTKTHDQVIKNVPSNERIAFLNDLTYIANAQSSIKQKRKTLKTMWNSYQSLRQST